MLVASGRMALVRVALIVGLVAVGSVLGANPDRPRSGSVARRPSVDCSGLVALSALGTNRVHSSGLVSYRSTLVDKGVGFNKETGEVTFFCNGLYQIAFAAYGDAPNTRVVLKKAGTDNHQWQEVVSAGSSSSGGGSNQVLLELADGDQVGLWLASGDIATSNDRRLPTTSFSALLLTKK